MPEHGGMLVRAFVCGVDGVIDLQFDGGARLPRQRPENRAVY